MGWNSIARIITYPLRHPTSVMRSAGTTAKTVAVGGAAAYVGWEKLTTDKSVSRIVGEAVVGENAVDTVAGAVNDVKELKETAGKAVDTVSDAMTDVNSKWSGMSKFFRGLFGGNPLDMFGNFFKNIGTGNISGLSIAGLVAAAFMVFGRFGFLGRILGSILGMTLIGNNASLSLKNNNKEMLQRQQEETQQSSSKMRR